MFEWNSLNPWGPGFSTIAFLIVLSLVLAPIVWVAQRALASWRKAHPKAPAPSLSRTPERDRPWDRKRGGWL